MINRIVTLWTHLILPPEGSLPRVRAQGDADGRLTEVEPDRISLRQHLTGFASYVLDTGWRDRETGTPLARVATLRMTADPRTLGLAEAVAAAAAERRLTIALQWVGGTLENGACQVWLFSEPAPPAVLHAALTALVAAVPGAAELATAPLEQTLLVPGWDRPSQSWAYFYRADERPTPVETEVIPAGLIEYQVQILEGIVPTPADHLAAFIRVAPVAVPSASADSTPAATAPPPIPAAVGRQGTIELLSDPSQPLRLMMRRADGAWEIAALEPAAALDLAQDLIRAVRRRWGP